jgi:hypothetical protein
MATSVNVAELVDEVRQQLDEFNETAIEDAHIVAALNRAQKHITRMLARRLDYIFLALAEIDTSAGTLDVDGIQRFPMPRDVFARRIEKVELNTGGSGILWRVKHISYKNRDPYVVSSQVTRPYYYDIIGTDIRFYPNINDLQQIFVHYSRTPDSMVLPQGQINAIDTDNNFIIVDSVGSAISTESDDRESFVSIVDCVTGDIKGTLQVAFIDSGVGQIKFKTSGLTRTTINGRPVLTAIPSDVTEDDYICLSNGTAVPQMPDAFTDYLTQHALTAVIRRIREPSAEEYRALKDIEQSIKKEIQGREQRQRIRKANSNYSKPLGSSLRRYFS